MQIKDYLNEILSIISEIPFIKSRNISFEERPPNAAYITGSITFLNGSILNFKEFIVIKSEGSTFLKYAYNYSSKDNTVIFRYDNALDPKAKKLSTYPEHKHEHGELLPENRPELKGVLGEISDLIENTTDLEAIKQIKDEASEDYKKYSQERKDRIHEKNE